MNRIVKTIAAVAIGAGALLSSWSMGSVAHAAAARPVQQVAYDNAFCAYFPEFGSSLRHAEQTRSEWAPLVAHWWADGELHADARSLLAYLRIHPHAAWTNGRYTDVYLGCNPDA